MQPIACKNRLMSRLELRFAKLLQLLVVYIVCLDKALTQSLALAFRVEG